MEWIRLTQENLATEHICCAISNERDAQVASKKAWLADRLGEGLVFLKGDVRGKCFIEYLPAENAWAPVAADGCMFIDCLWVAGQYKGHGYGAALLDACVQDSREKGKRGLVILSSPKKKGFLADRAYMEAKGFRVCDTAPPYFSLLYLPLCDAADTPRFLPCAKAEAHPDMPAGFTAYYSGQCPFPAKYVPLLADMARRRGAAFTAVPLKTRLEAQAAPCPFTAFSLFDHGAFVTHEIPSEKKFDALLSERGL